MSLHLNPNKNDSTLLKPSKLKLGQELDRWRQYISLVVFSTFHRNFQLSGERKVHSHPLKVLRTEPATRRGGEAELLQLRQHFLRTRTTRLNTAVRQKVSIWLQAYEIS